MLIAQALSWTSPETWWAIAKACIGLGVVIFVHELGHFLVAKACGVKCEKFYVGFDFFDIKIGDIVLIPRSLVKFQWGETEYGVGIVPLGGYVKMLGQDDNPGNMEKEIERSKSTEKTAESKDPDFKDPLDRDKMDPRSFLAKSVPQRMAIISAGVVFNIIFAIIFAAIAFKSGVKYVPPVVGDVTPGGPAWESNLFGANITRIGNSKVEGYYRFVDLAQEIALSGEEKPITLEYTLPGSDETKTTTLTPRRGLNDQIDLALIGIERSTIPRITADPDLFIDGHAAEKANPSFEPRDLIVKVNDTKVETGFDLKKILANNFDRPLEFVVERENDGATEQKTINVDVNPRRECGLIMKWGPVASIQQNSPASDAGIAAGDHILAIDYQPPGDLYSLEQRMTKIARDPESTVKIDILRNGKELTVELDPRIPDYVATKRPGQPVAINSLGIAITPTSVVEKSTINGISKGDEINRIEFVLDDPEQKRIFNKRTSDAEIELTGSGPGWETIYQLMQALPSDYTFKVFADQKHGIGKTTMSDEFFIPTRGVGLTVLQKTYQSPTWQDALNLGAYQTQWDGMRVFRFLGKLIRGQISPKNLGGPGTIAMAATAEASQGTSRLLLFLTLLSANLAIVNFLPIPVLDGGHMLFLIYEGLFRQPPNERVQIILTYAGLFLILGLMLYVILLDIERLSGWF